VSRIVQQSIAMTHAGGGDAWADESTFGFDEDWFARARAGKLRLPAEGADYLSLVHITDMARATLCAIDRWPSRQALIVADDEPATWRDLFNYVCAIAQVDPPVPGGRSLMPSFRVTNQRAREALAWSPTYRDYRSGLIR
jgi:nucleoside-diphosphate-sugar epimerase